MNVNSDPRRGGGQCPRSQRPPCRLPTVWERCPRQLSSWVAAMEHAAVGELAGRRIAEAKSAGARESEAGRYAAAEVAAALTLTRYSAENLVERALALADLPATFGALARGEIDVPKALVILAGVSSLDGELARRVEDQVLSK